MKSLRITIVILILVMMPYSVFAAADQEADHYISDTGYELYSDNQEIPTPYFNGISSILYRFVIEDGKAIPAVIVTSYSDEVDKVKFNVTVQKSVNNQWTKFKSWTETNTTDKYCQTVFSHSVKVTKGFYRMYTDVTAYKNGKVVDHTIRTSAIKSY